MLFDNIELLWVHRILNIYHPKETVHHWPITVVFINSIPVTNLYIWQQNQTNSIDSLPEIMEYLWYLRYMDVCTNCTVNEQFGHRQFLRVIHVILKICTPYW